MPGKLRCDKLTLDSPDFVIGCVESLMDIAGDNSNLHRLFVSDDGCHFRLSSGQPAIDDAGWYIIYDGRQFPIYVGTSVNLNKRLNTNYGSRDNFKNPDRLSDGIRNFIKVHAMKESLGELTVLIITETDFCNRTNIDPPLSKLDRENIEKVISIFRCLFKIMAVPVCT